MIAETLNSGGNSGGFRTEPGAHLVTHALTGGQGFDASEDGTGLGTPRVVSDPRRHDVRGVHRGDVREKPCLNATNNDLLFHGSVRRLTPIECERLQGFPDGFTCVCGADADWRACACPDSPRYRALGNAVTVNVIEWLGHRLRKAVE